MSENKTKRVKGGWQTPEGFFSNQDFINCAEALLKIYEGKYNDHFTNLFSNASEDEETEIMLKKFFDEILPAVLEDVKNKQKDS